MLRNYHFGSGVFAHFSAVVILLVLIFPQQVAAAVNKDAVDPQGVLAEDPGIDLWRNVANGSLRNQRARSKPVKQIS